MAFKRKHTKSSKNGGYNNRDVKRNKKDEVKSPERNGTGDGAHYTTLLLVALVYKWVRKYFADNGIDESKVLIIGPHSGDGRMVCGFENFLAFDKNPEASIVTKCETKDLDLDEVSEGYDIIIIVENPAFNNHRGVKNDYVEFFNHVAACSKVSHIMTIAPDRFRAHVCMRLLDKMFVLDKFHPITNTGDEYEKASGRTVKIPTSFIIWKRSLVPRVYADKWINVEKDQTRNGHYGGTPSFFIDHRPKKGVLPISKTSKGKNKSYSVYSFLPEGEGEEWVKKAMDMITSTSHSFVAGNFQNAVDSVFPSN
jgi:hypothetical protein